MAYNVKIVRSSRKRLVLTVTAENEIILKCPRGTSKSAIDSFIASKKSWLDKIVLKNEVKLSQNKAILNFEQIYVCGEKLPLIISDNNCITCDGVYVRNLKQIKNVYISHFSQQFINFVNEISRQTGLKFNNIEIKRYKRRWGCCDVKGKLNFNFLLFMLPMHLQRYVIIHELCHTVHFNHSKSFWQLVKTFEPNYNEMRKQLKVFDFLTNLY